MTQSFYLDTRNTDNALFLLNKCTGEYKRYTGLEYTKIDDVYGYLGIENDCVIFIYPDQSGIVKDVLTNYEIISTIDNLNSAITNVNRIKFESCIIQSAFLLDNGKRILVITSCWTGISSFECDEYWNPYPTPFATCPLNIIEGTLTDYHKRIREMHGLNKLVKEYSTDII